MRIDHSRTIVIGSRHKVLEVLKQKCAAVIFYGLCLQMLNETRGHSVTVN